MLKCLFFFFNGAVPADKLSKIRHKSNHTLTSVSTAPCFVGICILSYSQTPTCSPSSSLTFNPSLPRHQLSPHPFHYVRLLVIIIAAVSHLHCQALFGSNISAQILPASSDVTEITHRLFLFVPHLTPVSFLSVLRFLSHSLPHHLCLTQSELPGVCDFRGVGAFSGKQDLLCVYALM